MKNITLYSIAEDIEKGFEKIVNGPSDKVGITVNAFERDGKECIYRCYYMAVSTALPLDRFLDGLPLMKHALLQTLLDETREYNHILTWNKRPTLEIKMEESIKTEVFYLSAKLHFE